MLARSDAAEAVNGHTPDLDAVVRDLLRERADLLRERQLRVDHDGRAGVQVPAPPRVLGVVIGNLLRAVTQYAERGTLHVAVAPASLRITVQADAGAPRADEGERVLGLSMVRRVCERWNWVLEENAGRDGCHGFALHFGDSSAP